MKDNQKPMTKTEVISALAEWSRIEKQEVATVLEGLAVLIEKNLGDNGPGAFTIPGLMKLTVVHKPASEEREGINPFTKEPTVFKAKPASKTVKVRPLKALKDMV